MPTTLCQLWGVQPILSRPILSLRSRHPLNLLFVYTAHLPAPFCLYLQTVAKRLQELPYGEPALSSELAMPPSGSSSPPAEAGGRRWSLDTSLHSDWELLSHGAQSRCGSSPQSLLHSGYNSDAEAAPASSGGSGVAAAARAAATLASEAFRSARRRAEADETAASAGLDLPPVLRPDVESTAEFGATAQAGREPLQPFGSLVVPALGPLAGVAAGSAGGPGSPSHGSASSTPRSSFERTSSRASGHDLYSLSQVGAGMRAQLGWDGQLADRTVLARVSTGVFDRLHFLWLARSLLCDAAQLAPAALSRAGPPLPPVCWLATLPETCVLPGAGRHP